MDREVVAKDISCGKFHMAALTDEGEVWTWGRNDHGCLGRPGSISNIGSTCAHEYDSDYDSVCQCKCGLGAGAGWQCQCQCSTVVTIRIASVTVVYQLAVIAVLGRVLIVPLHAFVRVTGGRSQVQWCTWPTGNHARVRRGADSVRFGEN